jgi:hypothetical protein
MRRIWRGFAPMVLGLAVGVTSVGGGERMRFHSDVEAVRSAIRSVTLAVALDDTATARKQFDRLESLCRRVPPEDDAVFSEQVVNADRAYHMALDRAREFSGIDDGEMTFEAFVGVQKVCRACHAFARDDGLWPSGESADESR